MKRDSKNSKKSCSQTQKQEAGKQKRALLTRRDLIKSARTIFAPGWL